MRELQSEVIVFQAFAIIELHIMLREYNEAREHLEKEVLPVVQKLERIDLIAEIHYGLARVHEAEGRADLALPLAQEALKIYERLQHRNLAETRELVERLKANKPPP